MKNVKKCLITIAALFLVIFTGSCEIGLGESVDVNAPTVEVVYPPEGSIIRGGDEKYFLLAGNCDDDMGVKNVSITVTNISNNSTTKYEAVPQDKEWEKQISTEMTDGKYVVYVQAIDHYGRKSGIASLTFDLDNTAPQLYLTNPNPNGNTTFGRLVKLAGDLSEAHSTDAVYVYASENTTGTTLVERKNTEKYGADADYLFKIENVTEMSDSQPLMLARYYTNEAINGDEEKAQLTANYLKLYGETSLDTANNKYSDKTFYCAVELEDNAREYKDKTIIQGTGRGNISEKYKAYNGDADDKEYNSAEVTTNSSKFVLNPSCNPTYSFDGFELKSDVDARVMSAGSTLSININAGMDSTLINSDSIKVRVYKYDSKNAAIQASNFDPNEGQEITHSYGQDSNKYSVGLQIPNSLENKFYRVVCFGEDRLHMPLVSEDDKIFGFELSTQASPPEVTVVTESGNYYKAKSLTDGIELKVHTVVKGNPYFMNDADKPERIRFMVTQPAPATAIADLDKPENIGGKLSYTTGTPEKVDLQISDLSVSKTPNKDGEYDYTMKIKSTNLPDAAKGTGKYELFVVFHDGNKVGSDKFTFNVDNTIPVITDPKIEKNVEKDSKYYVNGTVDITATASDNYDLKKVTYKVLEGTNERYSGTLTSEDIKITVDTTKFSNNSKIKVELTAEDGVGNENTKSIELPYIVDQTTDKPNIEDGNITIDKSYADIVADKSNIFDSTSLIIGKVTDDDGDFLTEDASHKSTFKIYNKGTNTTAKDATNKDCEHTLENDKAYEYSVPSKAGFYDVVIEAFDGTYNEETAVDNKANRTNKKTTKIAIDNDTPTLKETKQNSEDTKYTKAAKVEFSGELEDDFPQFDSLYAPTLKVIINDDRANAITIQLTKVTNSTPKWSWNWNSESTFTEEKNYKLEFEATDIAGKTAVVTRNICYDKTVPTVGTVTLTPAGKDVNGTIWYNTTTFKVDGTASDTLSGIKELTYSIDNGSNWQSLNGCETFQGVINGLANGKSIIIKAKDNCGNESAVKTVGPLHIDQTAPTLTTTETKYKIDGVNTEFVSYTKAIVLNGSNKLGLQGKVQDEANGSGVKSVKVKFGNDNFADDAEDNDKIVEADITNGVFTAELPAANITGTGKIYIQMEDKAGNKSAVPFVDISFDNQYPEVKISNIKYFETDTIATVDKVNGKIDINGTSKDNQSVIKLELEYKLSTAPEYTKLKEITDTDKLLSWTFTVDTSDTTKFTDGYKYDFRVVATDSSGNIGNSYEIKNAAEDNGFAADGKIEVTINKDSDRPIIRVPDLIFEEPNTFEGMSSAVGKHALLYGKKKIYFSVSDDDGVKEIYYSLDNGTNWIPATNSIEFGIENEGSNAIKFKIVDKQGGEFISDGTLSPKLVNEEGKETTLKSSILYIDVDNYNPELVSSGFKTYDGTNWTSEYTSQDKLFFGGKYTKFNLKLEAIDPNGVQKIEIKFGNHTNSITKTSPDFRDADKHTWEFTNIPVGSTAEGLTDGNNTLEVTITDYAGNVANEKIIVNVDRSASTLNLDSHLGNGTETLGTNADFIFKGYLVNADSMVTAKYIVTNEDTTSYTENAEAWNSAKELKINKGSGYTWELRVDGASAGDEQYITHTDKTYKDLFVDLYTSLVEKDSDGYIVYKAANAADGKAKGDKYTKTKAFYFHFLVEDAVGNKSVTTKYFKIDPQGDIPTVSIAYPLAGSVETVSGKVKAHGRADAKGTHSIVGIYVQIDPNAGDDAQTFGANKWIAKDLDTVKKQVLCKGETSSTPTPKLSGQIEYIYERYNAAQTDDSKKKPEATGTSAKNMYGIYVGNESPWSYMINDEIKLVDDTNKNTAVGIRVYVVDSDGNISETPDSDVFIKIDSDVPTIEDLKVTQYAWFNTVDKKIYYTKPCTAITASTEIFTDSSCDADYIVSGTITPANYQKRWIVKDYEENMWLKGNWWLSGSIHDDSGIYKVESLATDNATAKEFVTGTELTVKNDFADNHKGFTFNYIIGSTTPDKFGTLEYKIRATEKNAQGGQGSKSNTKVITVKYDNKAPKLLAQTSPNFGIDSTIVNSNNFYTFGSTASENDGQSGVKRVVVYFTNGTNLYDAYWAQTKTENKLSTNATNVIYEDNLYWKKETIANTNTAIADKVVTITAADSNIHKGGLVKIGGSYFTVTGYNSTAKTVTLDEAPSSDYKGADIYFAVGHVIDQASSSMKGIIITDNTAEGYGYHTPTASDDDFIEESLVTRANGDAVWSAGINSNNLPDGNMTVNYVVFDEAGNMSLDTVAGKVSNNAPRIASVRVWCDYNGDGTENTDADGNYTESETYYYSRASRVISGTEKARSTEVTDLIEIGSDNSSFMTIKNKTYVIPELVGGNGKLYYTYEYNKGSKKVENTTKVELGDGNNHGVDEVKDSTGYYKADDNNDAYVIGTEYANKLAITTANLTTLGDSTKTSPTYFYYDITDSTPGGALSAKIKLYLAVNMTDSVTPLVNVQKFFWEKEEDGKNSLYKGSRSNGHIELEKDWEAAAFDYNAETNAYTNTIKTSHNGIANGLKDKDPKVSGKITIRGTAYDNKQLSELHITFGTLINVTAATCANGVWTSKSTDTTANMTTNHWTFTVTPVYNDQYGHFVKWECNLDTSALITNKAATNQKFTLVALDTNATKLSSANSAATAANNIPADESTIDETTFHRPSYQMDVVPYITTVTVKDSTGTAKQDYLTRRTALGHYPVTQYTSEHYALSTNNNSGSPKTWAKDQVTVAGFNMTTVTYSGTTAIDSSGNHTVTENSVQSLNNYNYNNAEYNKTPDASYNTTLKDDVIFDVWQFNTKAAISVLGNSGVVDNAVMKINNNNGLVGVAFSNDSQRFSMPGINGNNGTNWYSYRTWNMTYDAMKHNALAIDDEGNTFGVSLGGDINATNAVDKFSFMSSLWGMVDGGNVNSGSNGGTSNHIILETIGQGNNRNKDRFQNSSIAVVGTGATAKVYMAFYDFLNKEICFKYGENPAVGGFGDYQAKNSTENSDHQSVTKILAHSGANAYSKASPYVCVGATSTGAAIVIWYDGKDLWYAYNATPTGNSNNGLITTADKKGWSISKIASEMGQYCQLAVDASNNVHIACYAPAETSVKYIYIPSTSVAAPGTPAAYTVDSKYDVGQNLTIDVALNSAGKPVPYIGYYNATYGKPCYAYLADPASFYGTDTTVERNGAVNDVFTAMWECTIVPTPSNSINRRMNVGVRKYTDAGTGHVKGQIRATANGTSYARTSQGVIYGNGTANAIMGYINYKNSSSVYFETAQMK